MWLNGAHRSGRAGIANLLSRIGFELVGTSSNFNTPSGVVTLQLLTLPLKQICVAEIQQTAQQRLERAGYRLRKEPDDLQSDDTRPVDC